MTVESIFALCIYKILSHRSRFIELSIPYADLYNNKIAPLPLVDKRAFFNGGEGGIRTIEILTKATQTGGFFVILSEAKNPFLHHPREPLVSRLAVYRMCSARPHA